METTQPMLHIMFHDGMFYTYESEKELDKAIDRVNSGEPWSGYFSTGVVEPYTWDRKAEIAFTENEKYKKSKLMDGEI